MGDFNIDDLDDKTKNAIEKILDGHGGEDDSQKHLQPLPNKKQDYKHGEFTREMLWEKKNNLQEHLGVLEESLIWAINDVDIFEKKFEINPSKREELVQAVENIGKEIEMVKTELLDVDRHL